VTDSDDVRVITFRPTGEDWQRKTAEMRDTAEALLDAVSEEASSGARFEEITATREHRETLQEDEGP
jgi:hypothetical protein